VFKKEIKIWQSTEQIVFGGWQSRKEHHEVYITGLRKTGGFVEGEENRATEKSCSKVINFVYVFSY